MMSKVPRKLREQFQTKRCRLLYLIYNAPKSRIKNDPGIKSKLCKTLGYKSDGHFYYDLNYLINSNLLIEKDGYYKITREGKEEFLFLYSLKVATFASLVFGLLAVYYYWGLKTATLRHYEGILLLGITLMIAGVLYHITRRRLRPHIPQKAKQLLKE